jgi:hypothetical protein
VSDASAQGYLQGHAGPVAIKKLMEFGWTVWVAGREGLWPVSLAGLLIWLGWGPGQEDTLQRWLREILLLQAMSLHPGIVQPIGVVPRYGVCCN